MSNEDLRETTPGPDAADGLGVSSERDGPTGPGQVDTDGVRDTSPHERVMGDDVPPEHAPTEENPEGIEPAAGYPSLDPRSDDTPYEAPPQV